MTIFTPPRRAACLRLLALFLAASALVVGAADDSREAWKEIEKLNRELGRNDERGNWSGDARLAHLARLQQHLDYFLHRFPDGALANKARAIWLEAAPQVAEQLGVTFDEARWDRELRRLEEARDVSPAQRADVEVALINGTFRRLARGSPTEEQLEQLATRIESFVTDYSSDRRRERFALIAGQLVQAKDEARAARLFAVGVRSRDPELSAEAERAAAVLPFRHRPLEWEFTALDGRPVSLAALRGKVVVIDFWATWCGPCVRDVPEMIAFYRLFRGRDVEIIGVSLDTSRTKVAEFVGSREIEWPQYFDGGGWETKFSRRFKITSIPTVWVIGRDGKIVETEARGKVSRIVTKLFER